MQNLTLVAGDAVVDARNFTLTNLGEPLWPMLNNHVTNPSDYLFQKT
jgi:hypothetical protein